MKTKVKFFVVIASLTLIAQSAIIPSFDRMDDDGDENISMEEAEANTLVEKHFAELDANDDGSVDEEEFKGLKQIVKEQAAKKRAERAKKDKQNNKKGNKNKK